MNSDWIKVIVSTNSKINGICIYPSITISILPIRSITVKNCRNCNSCSECKVFNCPNISCKSKADVFNELLISPIAGFLVTLPADFWSSPYTHRLCAVPLALHSGAAAFAASAPERSAPLQSGLCRRPSVSNLPSQPAHRQQPGKKKRPSVVGKPPSTGSRGLELE